jgi:hypothetical protein
MAAVLMAVLSPAFSLSVLALTVVACGGGLRLLGYLGRQPELTPQSDIVRTGPTLLSRPRPNESYGDGSADLPDENISVLLDDECGVAAKRPYPRKSFRRLSFQN